MSIGRVVLGAALVARPEMATSAWIGKQAGKPAGRLLSRALGARDVGIGMGVLSAYAGGAPARGWLAAGLIADATDLTATVLERDGLPGTAVPVVGPLAAVGVVLGLVALAGGDAPADAA
jgi:hypothetical protein